MKKQNLPCPFPDHLARIYKLIGRVNEFIESRKSPRLHNYRTLREGRVAVTSWRVVRWCDDQEIELFDTWVRLDDELVYEGNGLSHTVVDLTGITKVLDVIDRTMVLDDMADLT